jgi:hypothetical protein
MEFIYIYIYRQTDTIDWQVSVEPQLSENSAEMRNIESLKNGNDGKERVWGSWRHCI